MMPEILGLELGDLGDWYRIDDAGAGPPPQAEAGR
jgi:hypothetical protein